MLARDDGKKFPLNPKRNRAPMSTRMMRLAAPALFTSGLTRGAAAFGPSRTGGSAAARHFSRTSSRLLAVKPGKEDPVLIVGAGVAGLSSAIALSNLGVNSIVLDRRTRDGLKDGFGISLQAKAIDTLVELGVPWEALVERGWVIKKQEYFMPDGRIVASFDKPGSKPGRPGQVPIHRGVLGELLLEIAESKGNIQVLTNHRVNEVVDNAGPGPVSVKVTDKDSGSELTLTGSAVIAADGLNSELRTKMNIGSAAGFDDPRRRHGVVDYRGCCYDFPPFLDGQTHCNVGGLQLKLVVYPITAPTENGGQMTNWVAAVKEPEPNTEDPQGHLLKLFEEYGFDLPFLSIKDLIMQTKREDIKTWAMTDLRPLSSWTSSKFALAGDAAHGMLPVGSAGAMGAILDATALRKAFEDADTIEEALNLYSRLRYDDATLAQLATGQQPAETIVQDVIETVKEGVPIPDIYGTNIKEAMKALQDPDTSAYTKS